MTPSHIPRPNIVRGQRVADSQLKRAKKLRSEMTMAEGIVWNATRANRLDGWHFRRQQPIGPYIVDFYCHAAGVVVEIDGEIHARQREYDALRDDVIASYGLLILRFSNDEVTRDLPSVLQRISATCRERMRHRHADDDI